MEVRRCSFCKAILPSQKLYGVLNPIYSSSGMSIIDEQQAHMRGFGHRHVHRPWAPKFSLGQGRRHEEFGSLDHREALFT